MSARAFCGNFAAEDSEGKETKLSSLSQCQDYADGCLRDAMSWYVNQTRAPAPAATVLRAMEPMYKCVQTNADRSVASIKQYTRKVETVEGQVKRLPGKPRTAVITNGRARGLRRPTYLKPLPKPSDRVIEDIDHVIKCLGFDCDFGIDRINHTRRHI
ncbi:unnamed protein product, partial [Symbiodinium sp. KB8]